MSYKPATTVVDRGVEKTQVVDLENRELLRDMLKELQATNEHLKQLNKK